MLSAVQLSQSVTQPWWGSRSSVSIRRRARGCRRTRIWTRRRARSRASPGTQAPSVLDPLADLRRTSQTATSYTGVNRTKNRGCDNCRHRGWSRCLPRSHPPMVVAETVLRPHASPGATLTPHRPDRSPVAEPHLAVARLVQTVEPARVAGRWLELGAVGRLASAGDRCGRPVSPRRPRGT